MRTLKIILITIFFSSSFIPNSFSDALDDFEIASTAFRENNLDAAISKYSYFIFKYSNHPKTCNAQFMIGECYFKQKKYTQAADAYKKVIKKYSSDNNIVISAYYRLGECNFNLGKYLHAIDFFEKVKKEKNKILRAESIFGIAMAKLAIDEKEQALMLFLELIKNYPGYNLRPKVILPLSLILLEKGKLNEAREYLEKIPESTETLYYLGVIYSKLNQIVKATALLKKVIELDPKGYFADKAQYQIGEAFYNSNQFSLSAEAFENLLKNYPESSLRPNVIYRLACADFKNENYNDAELKFQKLIKEYPASSFESASKFLLAEISLRQNDIANAIKLYSEILHINSLNMYTLFKIIWCHAQAGQYDIAIARSKKFLENYQWGDMAGRVYLIKALSYQMIKEYTEAIKEYQKIIDLFPDSIYSEKAVYLKAVTYYQAGQYTQLITDIYQFIKNFPATSNIWHANTFFIVAEGYYALKRYDLARQVYEIIVRNYPDSNLMPQVYQGISSCYAYEGNLDLAKQYQEKVLLAEQEIENKTITGYSTLQIGNIFFNQGQYEKAIGYYDDFISKNPNAQDTPKALFQAGIALYHSQYYSEAIKRWEQLVKNFRQSELAQQALTKIASTLFGLGDYDKAISYYQTLITYYPNSPLVKESIFQIAQCFYNKGDMPAAVAQYKKFIDTYPNDEKVSYALEQLEMCYYRMGKSSKELESLIGHYPKSLLAADTYWKLGAEAFNKKDYTKSHEYFQKIISKFPESSHVNKAAFYDAESYYLEGNFVQAINAYNNYIQNFPKDEFIVQAKFRLGLSYFNMADFNQSVVAFNNFIESFPENSLVKDAMLNIALSYKKSNSALKCIEAYNKFITRYPNDERIYFAQLEIGLQWENLNEYAKAIDVYRKIPETRLEYFEANYYIGRCYERLNLIDKVVEVYENMMKLEPKSNEFRLTALLRLAEIYEANGKIEKSAAVYRDVYSNSNSADIKTYAQQKLNALK